MRARLVAVIQFSLAAIGYTALALWLGAAPVLWITRDGLGPGSVETTGWTAAAKFSPVLLLGLVIVCGLALLHRWIGRTAK
jgi:hypothetical protein